MIVFTIIRVSGIRYRGNIDATWEMLWQTLAAEIGLILSAVSVFRALYVSRAKGHRRQCHDEPRSLSWWTSREGHSSVLAPRSWYRRFLTRKLESQQEIEEMSLVNLPAVPAAAMKRASDSRDMRYHSVTVMHDHESV